MPEQLGTDDIDLRQRAVELATGPLAALADADPIDHLGVAAASKAAGIFSLGQPTEFGGQAAGALSLAVAREALASHNVAHLPGLFGPSPGLLANVDEPIRSTYLEPMMAGNLRGAFAFTEPDSAPRHSHGQTDGDELVISGQKSYVTGGGDADFMSALIEVEGSGPAMVLIDTDLPGVELTRRFGSIDGSHHGAFAFTDVRVPLHNVVGAPGDGMKRAMTQVTGVRMSIAALCVGLCVHVVDHVERYLQAPHRSGAPLAAVERHRLRYGELRIATFAARSTLYRAARLIDEGRETGDDKAGVNEAMAAKVFATETIAMVVDTAIQIVGGQALADTHPLANIYQRVRALRLAEGTTDVLRLNVARGALDLGQGLL